VAAPACVMVVVAIQRVAGFGGSDQKTKQNRSWWCALLRVEMVFKWDGRPPCRMVMEKTLGSRAPFHSECEVDMRRPPPE